jgi:hypothetical protein
VQTLRHAQTCLTVRGPGDGKAFIFEQCACNATDPHIVFDDEDQRLLGLA